MALVMTGYGGPTGEDIGKLISNEMSHDEKHKNFLENLATGGNGKYIPSAPRIKERKTVPLPEAINHQYSDVKSRSFRGLFPEINRAYITLDSKLVLWNYFEGNQFTEYTKLDQIICAVGLMKPKPGIFVDKVKYVLVVATTVEIVMLGCVFDEDLVHGMITLYETQFYATTDDVVIEKIIGTNAGRIFMCGKDGCVYELHYQAQDGWFSRKCRKLNHSQGKMRTFLPEFLFGGQEDPIIDIVVDESRNLLFTLSQSSRAHTISAWSLGDDGMGMTFWARNATVNSDFSRELRLVSDNQTSNLKLSLVSLATIPRPESEKIVLSAISDNGSRLFFSLDENGYMGRRNLSLKFVRLCPPAIKNDHSKNIAKDPSYISASSPLGVSRAFYNKGVLLLGCSNDSSGALVVAVMQKKASCNPIESLLNESVETLPSPKIMDVHAIAEVPIELYSQGGHLYASSSFRAPLAGNIILNTQI
jgi:nuclear pore complex protein Nup155